MKMVGDDGVEEFLDINNLEESAGAFAALNAKANFQRVPHFFAKPIDLVGALMIKRNAVGFDTRIGHVCSNLIEQLCELPKYVQPDWATDERQTLPWLIQQQVERLAALKAGAH